VFDSSSKIPGDGILEGTFLTQVGNYDQCLITSGPKDASGEPKFKGKYCIFQPGFQQPLHEIINATITTSHEIQSLLQQNLVSVKKMQNNFNQNVLCLIVDIFNKISVRMKIYKYCLICACSLLFLERAAVRQATCDAFPVGCVRPFVVRLRGSQKGC
jgi:Nose resistant-to-fluoxetine protein, N-terminal domain